MVIKDFTLPENASQTHRMLSWVLWGGQVHVDPLPEEKCLAGGTLGPWEGRGSRESSVLADAGLQEHRCLFSHL